MIIFLVYVCFRCMMETSDRKHHKRLYLGSIAFSQQARALLQWIVKSGMQTLHFSCGCLMNLINCINFGGEKKTEVK